MVKSESRGPNQSFSTVLIGTLSSAVCCYGVVTWIPEVWKVLVVVHGSGGAAGVTTSGDTFTSTGFYFGAFKPEARPDSRPGSGLVHRLVQKLNNTLRVCKSVQQ